jgi:SAM-dependent methyltransferase
MESYEVFAPFYDAVMGDRGRESAYIASLIEKHHPEAGTVLELACGTGAILEHLRPRYEVAGLDVSKPMLDIAGRKVPRARLFHEDMTRFDLGEAFDVVLCVFDSLNHVAEFRGWEAVFDRAREHLAAGGIFLFDVNTELKLEQFSEAPAVVNWFGDDSLLLIDVTRASRRVYLWKIRVFEHVGGSDYRLHAEDIREVAFPAERIRRSLDRRFARVWSYDAERSRPTSRSLRLYFVCRAREGA